MSPAGFIVDGFAMIEADQQYLTAEKCAERCSALLKRAAQGRLDSLDRLRTDRLSAGGVAFARP